MKTTITLFLTAAALIWAVAQKSATMPLHYGKARAEPAYMRVGVTFGDPTDACEGRQQLCGVRQIVEKTTTTPAWADAEGRLYITRSGHAELDIYKSSLAKTEDKSEPLFTGPILEQKDSLDVEVVLSGLVPPSMRNICLPKGRYYVVETETRYIIQW